MRQEIKLCFKNANKAYCAVASLFKSRQLSRNTEEKSHTTYLRHVATYGRNTPAYAAGGDYNKLLFLREWYLRSFVTDGSKQKWESPSNGLGKIDKCAYSGTYSVTFSKMAWTGTFGERVKRLVKRLLMNHRDRKRPRKRLRTWW